jgi:hypothetical protein
VSAAPESLDSTEVSGLVGVPETALAPEVAAALPDSTPGAPWHVQMSALMWRHRSRPEVASALPPELRMKSKGITNAGFVQYAETPVGAYSEVMGAMSVEGSLLPRVHIPFIAVDSLPSVHAGRAHWALPKVMAAFTWQSPGEVRAEADGWWISARVVHTSIRIPLLGRSTAAQVRPGGAVGVSSTGMRGWARVVTVQVDVDPRASFAKWMVSGRHRGVLVTGARLSMSAARWSNVAAHV